jgi:hypothetical protein
VYAREVPDGEGGTRELTFGVSGFLIMNAVVMYDRETDTLWSQFLGRAVLGELAGTLLRPSGVTLTTWETWREAHPDTTVLDQGGVARDPYMFYYAGNAAGTLGETNVDRRLERKEFVLGIQRDDGYAKAYPFRHLLGTPVLNDEAPGLPFVVAFDAERGVGQIFDRTVDGRVLTFEQGPPTENGGLALRDAETGTLWSPVTGEALAGPLTGSRLELVPSFAVFWFAWSDFHPDTEFYEPGT